ncbi:MAG: rod shape-determining protein MreC [Gammaproteobacteria bacterium]
MQRAALAAPPEERPDPYPIAKTVLKFNRESRLLYITRGLLPRTILLAAAAIALMAVDQHGAVLAQMRGVLMTIVYPTEWLVSAPANTARTFSSNFTAHRSLVAENRRLKHDYLLAQIQLERLESVKRENRRLRELLNAAGSMRGRVVAASVLAMNTDPFANRITINAGHNTGVVKEQPLLDAYGIVGQTLHVGPITSQVMLISDPASAVPVEISRTGLATVAVGTGNLNRITLPYLPNSADVKAGDKLLTSGLGGIYPRGYPVGVVTSVTPQPGSQFAKIEARPFAELGREREVLLYFTGAGAKNPQTREHPAKIPVGTPAKGSP